MTGVVRVSGVWPNPRIKMTEQIIKVLFGGAVCGVEASNILFDPARYKSSLFQPIRLNRSLKSYQQRVKLDNGLGCRLVGVFLHSPGEHSNVRKKYLGTQICFNDNNIVIRHGVWRFSQSVFCVSYDHLIHVHLNSDGAKSAQYFAPPAPPFFLDILRVLTFGKFDSLFLLPPGQSDCNEQGNKTAHSLSPCRCRFALKHPLFLPIKPVVTLPLKPGIVKRAHVLWTAYQDWCAASGAPPCSETMFGRTLPRHCFRKKRGRVVVYFDVRLRGEETA